MNNSSGLGYIGSKLSLISKSNVRYVGILSQVDTINSTIALIQVQSFGSEGRRIAFGEEEIVPSNIVYNYILFRGSDIKDLQVYEPPLTNINLTELPYYMPHPHPATTYSYPITYHHPYQQQQQSSSSFIMTQKPQVPDDSDHHREALNRSYFNEKMNSKVHINNVNHDDNDTLKIIMPSNTMSSEAIALGRSIFKPNVKDSPFISSNDIVVLSVDELDIGKVPQSSTYAHSIVNKKQQWHKMDRHYNNKLKCSNDITKLKEFDFESSNSKFNKKENQQDPTSFYDKRKSFFDNISCDAKEKSETSNKDYYHKNHFDERLLNMETFGQFKVERKRKYSKRRSNNYHY